MSLARLAALAMRGAQPVAARGGALAPAFDPLGALDAAAPLPAERGLAARRIETPVRSPGPGRAAPQPASPVLIEPIAVATGAKPAPRGGDVRGGPVLAPPAPDGVGTRPAAGGVPGPRAFTHVQDIAPGIPDKPGDTQSVAPMPRGELPAEAPRHDAQEIATTPSPTQTAITPVIPREAAWPRHAERPAGTQQARPAPDLADAPVTADGAAPPEIHIGRIEVVMAPAPQPPARPSARAPAPDRGFARYAAMRAARDRGW